MSRIVCQSSWGAASAVDAKLGLAKHPDAAIVNAFLVNEHGDNRRFAADTERTAPKDGRLSYWTISDINYGRCWHWRHYEFPRKRRWMAFVGEGA